MFVCLLEFDRRQSFLLTLDTEEGSPHLIRLSHIYQDVLKLYANFNLLVHEDPFRVAFDDEEAIDTGGVSRDMFSGFWKAAFDNYFDGSGSLVPATNPDIDISALPLIGTILSHGYISCGFLPVHISFPILAAILLGPTIEIGDAILCENFITHLSQYDASTLRDVFQELGEKSFSSQMHSRLESLLSNYGNWKKPSPTNLKTLVSGVARHHFLVKPLAHLMAMNRGVPVEHRVFWSDVNLDSFMNVYLRCNATAASALRIIEEPMLLNAAEEAVFQFLRAYIGDMKNGEVRDFLRFVTGSSALVVDAIKIAFNGLSGLARRPIAHTCSGILELPTSYATLREFSQEFNALLSSELSWVMNSY